LCENSHRGLAASRKVRGPRRRFNVDRLMANHGNANWPRSSPTAPRLGRRASMTAARSVGRLGNDKAAPPTSPGSRCLCSTLRPKVTRPANGGCGKHRQKLTSHHPNARGVVLEIFPQAPCVFDGRVEAKFVNKSHHRFDSRNMLVDKKINTPWLAIQLRDRRISLSLGSSQAVPSNNIQAES
jgi:hypothetical protein